MRQINALTWDDMPFSQEDAVALKKTIMNAVISKDYAVLADVLPPPAGMDIHSDEYIDSAALVTGAVVGMHAMCEGTIFAVPVALRTDTGEDRLTPYVLSLDAYLGELPERAPPGTVSVVMAVGVPGKDEVALYLMEI